MPQINLIIEGMGKGNTKYGSFKANGEYWSYKIGAMVPIVGSTVCVEYDDTMKDGKTYHNISREILIPQGQKPPGEPAVDPSKRYDLKDRIITRIAIAKSCIEAGDCTINNAQEWLDWVEGRTKINPEGGRRPPPPNPAPRRQAEARNDFDQRYDDGLDEIPY